MTEDDGTAEAEAEDEDEGEGEDEDEDEDEVGRREDGPEARAAFSRAGDPARLRALGDWADLLGAPGDTHQTWSESRATESGAFTFSYPAFDEHLTRFQQWLYDEAWIVPFDWPTWAHGTGTRLVTDPEAVRRADGADLSRTLTAIFRAERFGDGVIAQAFEQGVIQAVLWRAREPC